MAKMKTYWLSYDLGVGGDYESLYSWLDNHKAKPCGDSVAYFKYQYEEGENPDEKLKNELLDCLDLKGGNKLYLIRRKEDGSSILGSFIYGTRSAAPWVGYGSHDTIVDE
ncbi:hypothetical protein [uncultured Bacteroides sp.]|uniref:hypothetical protein n=1 Tax=uncultured Bacteroides sp. TaxID=162156 RepID=UPI00261F5EAD|nr:hypothetical protein [uncultured Bacteroides sp.]